MIRHVAVFTFVPTFTGEPLSQWMALVAALPQRIPQVRSMSIGVDVVHGPSSHDLAIVADFDSVADLDLYSAHPAHAEVLAISGPVKTSLAVVDFEL